jgi:hypothetical protein
MAVQPTPTLTEKLHIGAHGIPVELPSPERDEYLDHNEALVAGRAARAARGVT